MSCFCGSTESFEIRSRIRGGKERKIVQCEKCGAARKANADKNQHRRLHENNQQVEEIDLETNSEEYRNRNFEDIHRRTDTIKPNLTGNENVLDIGTGMGHFLTEIEPYVDQVVSTEINTTRISFVRNELGFQVFEGTDNVMEEFGTGYFDVITMFHTLEHLINPVEQLRLVNSLVKDDGMIYIEIPNHDDYLLQLSNSYADFYYQDAHAYYFDPNSLKIALEMSDFRTSISGVQRYSINNAIHWLFKGEPELNDPSRYQDSWKTPIDKMYGSALKLSHKSDTIWAQAQPINN